MIMNIIKLGSIIRIVKGKKAGSIFDVQEESRVRFIQIDDLRNDNNLKFTDKDGVFAESDDVIIVWDGANAGTIGYGLNGVIGSTLAKLEIENDGVYVKYLGRFLQSKSRYLRDRCTGATIPHISKQVLINLKISLPSYDDQKRIAKVLDVVDVLRQKRRQAIKLLDDYLKSVLLEMFGDPVKNPKGWEVKELSELVSDDCPLTYGIVQPGDEYIDGTYVVRPVDLVSDYVGNKGLKRIDPAIDSRFKRTRLKGGELLMCVRGTTGITSIARPELRGANVTRGITPIWFSEGYDSLFAFHQIRSESIQQSIQEKTYGIALQQINLKDVRVLKLIVPPISLQKKFTALATKVELIKQKMVVQSEELENQFQSLMQKAFKGEL